MHPKIVSIFDINHLVTSNAELSVGYRSRPVEKVIYRCWSVLPTSAVDFALAAPKSVDKLVAYGFFMHSVASLATLALRFAGPGAL